ARTVNTSVGRLSIDSCFRFDVPVWTERGLRPIHEIELGDRVLSKDVRTGELAFKPVVWRTLRPTTAMIEVVAGGDAVHATRAHPFAVDARGWVKTRDLISGMSARTYCGKATIEALKASRSGRAFNLEVDDFGTFFVGKSGILVHDNAPIRD
ncbi:MAG TPA: polymorphic toxin-type HINT domain-containing protein, partial [Planctomycetia bacterium]|nr:polymorphic toxin-type HINT domain-containing protein [Planctomycetia bacterium]